MNKIMLEVAVERKIVLQQLNLLTNEELCKALKQRALDDEMLCSLLSIKRPEPEEPEPIVSDLENEFRENARALCEAIAETRTRDALDIVFELARGQDLNLLHPSTQQHLAELWSAPCAS